MKKSKEISQTSIRPNFRFIFALLAMGFLGACATTGKYEAKLQSWIGSSADSLVASWGYPTQTTTAPSGNKLLVYSRGQSVTMPVYQSPYEAQETATNSYNQYNNTVQETRYRRPAQQPQTINLSCTTFFEVDSSNNVVRWSWQGNNCTSN